MKRLLLMAIAMLCTGMAMAVPAHPGTARVLQPDGTALSIRLIGDEYLHFNTTADGYTIALRADGFYAYAQLDADGQLEPTARVAHDAAMRSAGEQAWLQGVKKYLAPKMTATAASEQQAEQARQTKARAQAPYNYSNFKGLILLVQYNDRQFSRSDYPELISNMANQENYTGYDSSRYGTFTGSVRDYYYDNSGGMFAPQFDVVGPVTIDYSQYDAHSTDNAYELMYAAITAADPLVDYSQYDRDGDGTVDMVYFIFAGLGANYGGNSSDLLWPHASYFWGVRRDGVSLGRYACSTELAGYGSGFIEGIGTICHEFGHVLGLPDLYDTDYEGGGGQSAHPAEWTIMAGGGYLDNSRTPAGYTLYERYALGFTTPQLLSQEGSYSLSPIGSSNTGYRLNTPVNKEFFLIENRQQTSKWDQYLPGHGMLVFRVDSTNAMVWRNNAVNNNPKHNYFVLLRARANETETAKGSDPFPGTGRVTTLNNTTSPANLLTWASKATPLGFENIKESGGLISFDLVDVYVLKSVGLPSQIAVGRGLTIQLEATCTPDYAPYTLAWSSSNPSVATVNDQGLLTGVSTGQAVITVTANDDASLQAQCTVTVEDLNMTPDIASYKALELETEAALKLTDALVLYANATNVFVRDATGAINFANTGLELEAGDLLNGMVYGKLAMVNKVPQLQKVEPSTNSSGYTVTKAHEVKPRELTIDELTDDDRADLITIKGVRLERKVVSGKTNVWAVGDGKELRLFNSYQIPGISLPKTIGAEVYDVTGIYITNKLGSNIIDEVQMTTSPVVNQEMTAIGSLPPADATATASIYTADGRLAATAAVGSLSGLPLSHGIYIVKAGNRTWRIAK